MKYMLLIYGDEAAQSHASEVEQKAEMAAYFAFTEEVSKAGVFAGGEALHPVSSATTVRVRNGKSLAIDGPFAETKEQLGGYYILECETLDQATAWAAKIPGARAGSIEVRPIIDFSQYPQGN